MITILQNSLFCLFEKKTLKIIFSCYNMIWYGSFNWVASISFHPLSHCLYHLLLHISQKWTDKAEPTIKIIFLMTFCIQMDGEDPDYTDYEHNFKLFWRAGKVKQELQSWEWKSRLGSKMDTKTFFTWKYAVKELKSLNWQKENTSVKYNFWFSSDAMFWAFSSELCFSIGSSHFWKWQKLWPLLFSITPLLSINCLW